MPWCPNQRIIEVKNDFLVTYDCHRDAYTVDGKKFEGWKTFADYKESTVHRKKIRENKQEGKVTWALRKTTEEKRTITWELELPPNSSNKLLIFVNSASMGKGQVKWTLNIPRMEMMCQLTPRVVNCIQWIDRTDKFRGSGTTFVQNKLDLLSNCLNYLYQAVNRFFHD